MKKQSFFGLITLFILMTAMVISLQAMQALPESPWYAIVHQPETDTLHWMNADGEQASIQRPILPDEAQYLDMRISPDGRTMVMISELNSAAQGIGVYDFESGAFIQTHQASPGETVYIGGENIFSTDSQNFALGFFSGDYENPAWRVILFNTPTGDAINVIDNTHPDAPQVQLSAPAVQYLDDESVHFQMIPQGVGGSMTWDAYAWRAFVNDPTPEIVDGFYTSAGTQLLMLTGETTLANVDNNYPLLPQNSPLPSMNAIGRINPVSDVAPTLVHADGTRFHVQTRWAKGGEYILFSSSDEQDNIYWSTVLADGTPGNNGLIQLDPQYVKIYGTTDGYLTINTADELIWTNGATPILAPVIAQLTPQSRIVYVTPIGLDFTLPTIADNDQVIVPTVIVDPAPQDCSDAPLPRMVVGENGRVIPESGALNMRQAPAGEFMITLDAGTPFAVLSGPICAGGFYWWQIELFETQGWVAEGVGGSYFIEPFDTTPVTPSGPDGFAPNPTTAPTLPPLDLDLQVVPIQPTSTPLGLAPTTTPTSTPLQLQIVPIQPTATPLQFQFVPLATATP